MKAPLRIVFLGCGFITGVHSRHLRRLRHLFLPGYASRDRGKAEAFERRYGGRGVTAVEQRELWNMPIILVALLGLACAEWGYRRLVGLV